MTDRSKEERLLAARTKIEKAVLRKKSSEMDEPHAAYDAELEYCDDMIGIAAMELVQAMGMPE